MICRVLCVLALAGCHAVSFGRGTKVSRGYDMVVHSIVELGISQYESSPVHRHCTGIVYEGAIITAAHCLGYSDKFYHYRKREEYFWKPLHTRWYSKTRDIAVILPLKNHVWANTRFCTGWYTHEEVFTVGHPDGSPSYTISRGYLVSRETAEGLDLLVSSANALPGNSGGALVNRSGCILGMVIKRRSYTTSLSIPSAAVLEQFELFKGRK